MRIIIFFVSVLTISFSSKAQQGKRTYYTDPYSIPREHPVDIQKMTVDVKFDPYKKLVKGKVTHEFTALRENVDSIFFDGPGISIQKAILNGKSVGFHTIPSGVYIKTEKYLSLQQNHILSFEYEANPAKGIYFIGWDDPRQISRKQIWTQGQGIDNRHWIPMYDDPNDKYITETIITFDAEYQVLSNGTKIKESKNSDGTKTWNYRMSHRHAGYLLMLAIGKYGVKSTKSKSGVPVNFWYYPDQPQRVEPTSRHTELMLDFLERETGTKYPWEAYSQVMVQDFLYGAMENTTATIFGDFFYVDEREFLDKNYIGVNCHELTHQWFGDYITARASNDTWLQESWATYYGNLFYKEIYGADYYQWIRKGELNTLLEAGKKDRLPIRHSQSGSPRVYQKGSQVIHMLRYVLGDDAFKRAIRRYLSEHAYENVETNDLYQAIQDELGLSLDWFFDQWIYHGGEPHYKISYQDLGTNSGRYTQVNVSQEQVTDDFTGLFRMPVWFQVHYTDGSYDSILYTVANKYETVRINNTSNKEISFVLFDPGANITKTTEFKRSPEELGRQLQKAKNMIDRYDALLELKEVDVKTKRPMLMDAFHAEAFWAVKAELTNQLSKSESKDQGIFEIINRSAKHKDPNVRLAAVNGPDSIQNDYIPILEQLLNDSSYMVVQAALERLAQANPSKLNQYLMMTANQKGPAMSLRIKWLELAIGSGNKEGLTELINYTSNSYEFRTRINAINALKSLNHLDNQSMAFLFDAATNSNGRLRGPAISALEYYAQQSNQKVLIRNYAKQQKWEKRKLEYLKNTSIPL